MPSTDELQSSAGVGICENQFGSKTLEPTTACPAAHSNWRRPCKGRQSTPVGREEKASWTVFFLVLRERLFSGYWKQWAMVTNGVTLFHFDPKLWVKNAPQKITIQMLIRWNLLSNEGMATFDLLSQLHLVPCYICSSLPYYQLWASGLLPYYQLSESNLCCYARVTMQASCIKIMRFHKKIKKTKKTNPKKSPLSLFTFSSVFFNELSLWAKQWELISPF